MKRIRICETYTHTHTFMHTYTNTHTSVHVRACECCTYLSLSSTSFLLFSSKCSKSTTWNRFIYRCACVCMCTYIHRNRTEAKYCDLQNNFKFDRPLRNDFGPLFLIPTTQLYKKRTLDGDSTHPGVL